MTHEELLHLVNHVLPAIRKDGAYIPGEEKVLTGEISVEEFEAQAMEYLRAKFHDSPLLD